MHFNQNFILCCLPATPHPPQHQHHLHSSWTLLNSLVSGDVKWDCMTGESKLDNLSRPCSSRTSGEGHERFSIWSLEFSRSDLHLLFVFYPPFFLLILQPTAMVTSDDIAHTREVKCGERRWLGGHRLVSLFAPLCVSGCSVWSARLAGNTAAGGLFTGAKKAMQILPFTKWHSAYTVQMGNLQTNSSWSWMRYWQSLNAPQTIRVWLQLTTRANEFPRWDWRAWQTTWRPVTTESLMCFYTRASKMHRLASHSEWNVPTLSLSLCMQMLHHM